jgi:valyl-tRNA synthetase
MIMAGLEFMDAIPFTDVYFTGMIRDMQGRKMSKSLGNSPDPLDVIAEYGADALRFTISYLSPLGQDIYYSNEKCEIGRNFANKIWNASRFLFMNLEDYDPERATPESYELTLADKWIISEFNKTVERVDDALEKYHFTEMAKVLYDFIWHTYCDWYLELIKHRFYQSENPKDKEIAQHVALTILEGSLRLLHPIMPFITEEIWQKLPNTSGETIMKAEYPQVDKAAIDEEAIHEMELLMEIIGAIRNIRGEMNVPPGKKATALFKVNNIQEADFLKDNQIYIQELAKIETIEADMEMEKPKASASSVVSGIEIYVPLKGLIDFEVEQQRLLKEIEKTKVDMGRSTKKLGNENFLTKAPEEVVQKERDKLKNQKEHLKKLEENLAKLK